MKKELTKAQSYMAGRTIAMHLVGMDRSKLKTMYSRDFKHDAHQVIERLQECRANEYDLKVAAFMKHMPYSHSENESELAIQLLVWHKLNPEIEGQLDSRLDRFLQFIRLVGAAILEESNHRAKRGE